MIPSEIIRKKRDGAALSVEEIDGFISGYVSGEIPNYQVSALLMAIFFRGMSPDETAVLTRSMMESGRRYELSTDRPLIDKHSTGGVGDKVSLVLAPLAAACGLAVPMVAGRGLGHTGGTLDKLQSIDGFDVFLSEEKFKKQVETLGAAIIGQSEDFVPADKKLYALRDVTGTVECIPLLCSSILSKKAASGAQGLVMDVKCGSGAFMADINGARELAKALVATGQALGLPVRAILTDMNQPLGRAIGNALEVRETLDCLRGCGPADLREITLELVAEMLVSGGVSDNLDTAREIATARLDDGAALDVFRQMVEQQGGNVAVADDPDLLPGGCETAEYAADRDGFVMINNCREIGIAALVLGAGRRKTDDAIDPAVGIVMHAKAGDQIATGEPLATIYYRKRESLEECVGHLKAALAVTDEKPEVSPLILERVS